MKEIVIIRRDRETGEEQEITLAEAIRKLSGYWKEETIESMLFEGTTLWTPYADYIPVKKDMQS